MIALQFARGVTSTSEWRKTVNIFNYRSSKQFLWVLADEVSIEKSMEESTFPFVDCT